MVPGAVNDFVRRTCTEITGGGPEAGTDARPLGFEEFAETGAYVLLGAPGSGKTTEFERQAGESGGHYVTARNFLTFEDKAEWHGVTLFIDALDERRAGRADGDTPLDAIRAKLARLGGPKFRLSCREADWFGSNDRDHLEAVAPDGIVRVLHLDPLSEEDAEEILHGVYGIEAPQAFIGSARERGVDGMLVNPQSLGLLARAVKDDDWPSTRTETFELACAKLVREHDQAHRIAVPESIDTEALMRAAGKLFAVQLLTGAEGFQRLQGEGTRDYPALEDLRETDGDVLRRALHTKLFMAPDGKRAVPFHRQIAEFVAARYLAARIAEKLPVGRVLALVTGLDGTVVTELRGLCGWLAAQSPSSRAELIARDPLGTVLYGDVQGFTRDEKRRILAQLEESAKENPWFVRAVQIDSRLGDLMFPEVGELFRDRIRDSRRDDRRQAFVWLVVEMLAHGEAVDGVAPDLMRIVRDGTWWSRNRHGALDAFIVQRDDQAAALADLKALAQDLYAGRVADPDDALLGFLLDTLYPEGLSEREVLGFLRVPKRAAQILSYEYFWLRQVGKRSNCAQLARMLDHLVELRDRLFDEVREHGQRADALRRVPCNLLERYLSTCEVEPDPQRLFGWLGMAGWVGDWELETRLLSHARERIGVWIGERPDLWKSLMELGLQYCVASMERSDHYSFDQLMWMERERRFFEAPLPLDFGSWCLDHAIVVENRAASAWLIQRVSEAVHRSNGREVSRKTVDERIAGNDFLQREFNRRLDKLKGIEQAERKAREKPAQRLNESQRQWRALVRESEVKLRENKADVRLLHRLAQAYLGGYGNVAGGTARERLNNLLGDDPEMVETVLTGIRGAVTREDLPSDDEVIRLGASRRMHYLSYPFLAGLNEIQQEAAAGDGFLDGDRARLALALHFNVAVWPESWNDSGREPQWFGKLLDEHPELVAEVLIRTAKSELRGGRDFSQHLFDLAYSADHGAVACLAVQPLLSAFPVRCVVQQLSSLRHLLVAACLHCEREALVELVERKLSSRSMNMAQRVYWLGTGLIVRPTRFVARLESYVVGNERRVLRVSQFFASRSDTPRVLMQQLDVRAVSLLIQTIGALHHPYSLETDSEKGIMVTPGMEAADRVHGLINQLASDASGEASEALGRLSVHEGLVAWRAQLVDSASRQNAIRRDASFAYADVGRVVGVLNNASPANAADLAAVTSDQLRRTARWIRDGNTSAWRKFWNVDSYNRAVRPKPENAGRDALIDELRPGLQTQGIDAQPEGSYADDKQADIRVAYGGFNVPVEIKRSCHSDLWSAIRSQLMAKYARDSEADGHGIYVVFWFGDTEHCRPTPGIGGIPASAGELEQRLVEGLSAEERRKIAVCVIDVAIPHGARLTGALNVPRQPRMGTV